ncbi:MAG: hypothetical protein J6I32_03795 [Bacteroidaceae bacterium]|nr:hypothetical protein [Bacteroidaceae bacterium]
MLILCYPRFSTLGSPFFFGNAGSPPFSSPKAPSLARFEAKELAQQKKELAQQKKELAQQKKELAQQFKLSGRWLFFVYKTPLLVDFNPIRVLRKPQKTKKQYVVLSKIN